MFVGDIGIDQLPQRPAAVDTRTENHTQPAGSQQVVARGAGKGIQELRIPGRPEKCVGSNQRACADAGHDIECRSRTGAAETGDGAGPERAPCAAPGECKNHDGFPRMCGTELPGGGDRGQLRELMIGTQRAKGQRGSLRRPSADHRQMTSIRPPRVRRILASRSKTEEANGR